MSDYGALMGKALPGCLVDSSRYNINGAGYCADNTIMVGKVVFVKEIVDGYKGYSSTFTNGNIPIGVVVRDHVHFKKDEEGGYMVYEEGDPISVATRGRIWCLTENIDTAPEPGARVYTQEDGFVTNSGGAGWKPIDNWVFTGDFMKFDNHFNLVGVQMYPFILHIHKLTSAIIEDVNGSMPDGDRPNNAPVNLKVSVAPEWATDKTGTWVISIGDDHAVIAEGAGETATITPNGTVGEVYVNWTANDGSGVADTFRINFIEAIT